MLINEKTYDFSWPDLNRDDSYIAQHKAILNNDETFICSYQEGLNTLNLIDDIRSWKN